MRFLPPQAVPLLQAVWRHKWLGVATAWLVCTAGWIGVALVPTKYESSARVYLNADPLLTPLLRGLAADTDPTRQLDFMQRTLLSRPNLEQLVRLTDLDIGVTTPEQKEALFKRLGDRYLGRAGNPELADPVLSRSGSEHGKERRSGAADDLCREDRRKQPSRHGQCATLPGQRDQLVSRPAARPPRNGGQSWRSNTLTSSPTGRRTPRSSGDESLSRLDQARSRGRPSQARTRRCDDQARRIAKGARCGPADAQRRSRRRRSIVNGGRLSPIDERLQEIRRNLDSLLLKYTDEPSGCEGRPTVRSRSSRPRGRRRRRGRGNPAAARQRARSPTRSTNRSRSGWSTPKRRSPRCSGVSTTARTDQERIEKVAKSAPGVLVQAQDLDRDYSILKRNYQELVARREATQIANAADTKTEKIQFRIVDPPQVPILPAAPNRPMLVSMVLLFGIGAGLAVPLALTQIDRSFATVGQLRNLGLPILGSVIAALARRGAAPGRDPAGGRMRERFPADRGIWNLDRAEHGPPYDGHLLNGRNDWIDRTSGSAAAPAGRGRAGRAHSAPKPRRPSDNASRPGAGARSRQARQFRDRHPVRGALADGGGISPRQAEPDDRVVAERSDRRPRGPAA